MKHSDGKYHIDGKKFDELIGSRAKVYHGTAYKTSGDLKKKDLFMNKHGRIVSAKKHKTAKRERRLEKAGFFAKKGKFGAVRKDGAKTRRRRGTKGKKSRGRKSRGRK